MLNATFMLFKQPQTHLYLKDSKGEKRVPFIFLIFFFGKKTEFYSYLKIKMYKK